MATRLRSVPGASAEADDGEPTLRSSADARLRLRRGI